MTRRYQKVEKTFLNDAPDELGSICWSVFCEGESSNYHHGELNVFDCKRSVTLEFEFSTPQEAKERIAKIDTMIDSLVRFRKAIGNASFIERGSQK